MTFLRKVIPRSWLYLSDFGMTFQGKVICALRECHSQAHGMTLPRKAIPTCWTLYDLSFESHTALHFISFALHTRYTELPLIQEQVFQVFVSNNLLVTYFKPKKLAGYDFYCKTSRIAAHFSLSFEPSFIDFDWVWTILAWFLDSVIVVGLLQTSCGSFG